MPITVKDLIQGRQELTLVTIQYDDYAQNALEKMRENHFSQLPVLGKDDNLIGIVTNNSILNALQTFVIPVSKLRVSHATDNKVSVCKEDNELSDVFADVKRYESVVIQPKEGQKPIGIITIFDMLEFYGQRAENIILLNNIETALKDHIRVAFLDKEIELKEAIDQVYNRTTQTLEQFKKAIKHYKSLESERVENFQEEKVISEVFERHFADKNKSKTLEDLSFDNFIRLLLDPINQEYCKLVFNHIENKAIENLLVEIRNIRNALFHFRREIISDDNKKLRFCSDWLVRHPTPIPESQNENIQDNSGQIIESNELITSPVISDHIEQEINQTDEENLQADRRYIKLEEKLSQLSQDSQDSNGRYQFSFESIEKIIENRLPKAAREDRSWWSDDDNQPWVLAGWNVLSINIIEEVVTFIYRPNRKIYIEFFQNLLSELTEAASFRVRFPYQDGRHYITVATIPDQGVPVGSLAYSFTEKYKKFRVELFIDKNEWNKNQEIYNGLKSHEMEIESELNNKLYWEPFENKPYSRVSLPYDFDILITDREEELAKLRGWAIDAMIRFQKVMNKYVIQTPT